MKEQFHRRNRNSTKINSIMTPEQINRVKIAQNISAKFYQVRPMIVKRRTAFDIHEWRDICTLLHMVEKFQEG